MPGFAGFAGLVGLAGLAGLAGRDLQPGLKNLIWGRSRFPFTFPVQSDDFGICSTKRTEKTTKSSKSLFGHAFHGRLWSVGTGMSARSRDSQRQDASGPMDWPPPAGILGWMLKKKFGGRSRFPYTFPLQNCDFGTIRANIKKCENC